MRTVFYKSISRIRMVLYRFSRDDHAYMMSRENFEIFADYYKDSMRFVPVRDFEEQHFERPKLKSYDLSKIMKRPYDPHRERLICMASTRVYSSDGSKKKFNSRKTMQMRKRL